jgi:hypothetical protein
MGRGRKGRVPFKKAIIRRRQQDMPQDTYARVSGRKSALNTCHGLQI